MRTVYFTKILSSLSQLTVRQRKYLIDIAGNMHNQTSVPVELDQYNSRPSKCPHCEKNHFVRFGIVSNLQRYRCRNCFKTFNILTGTPLAHLRHKEQWHCFAQGLIAGHTVRKSAINCMV